MIVLFFVFAYVFADSDILRIRRGDYATIDKYPFVVSILVRQDFEEWRLLCGGTVISPFNVLTSGFCINVLIEAGIEIEDILVRGNTELWKCDCQRARDHTLSGFLIHEGFKRHLYRDNITIYENDVGILRVIEEFDGLYEIPLPYNDSRKFWDSPLVQTRSLGWGFRSPPPPYEISDQMSLSTLVLLDKHLCDKAYSNRLVPNVFCASLNGDTDVGPCTFDYGGPTLGIVVNTFNILIGIISSGLGCVEKPVLFTNISNFVTWIDDKLAHDSDPNNWY